MTDDEAKDFVVKNFDEYFKSTEKEMNSKLDEEKSLRKVAELLYIFLTTPGEVEKYVKMMQSSSFDICGHRYNIEIFNLFDPELQLINTES